MGVLIPTTLYPAVRRLWWKWTGYPAQEIADLLGESQWWSRGKLEDFRNEKLRRLIEYCYYHVPYYRRVFDQRSLKPGDIKSERDLVKLPLLTKSEVRANWNDLSARNHSSGSVFIAVTGGSTGEPMRIAKGVESEVWASMCFERGLSWGGLEPGTGRIVLTGGSVGASPKTLRQKVVNQLSGQINLLAYDLTKTKLNEYSRIIRGSRLQFMIGYANNIYHLARLLVERGEELHMKAVFTTAERMLPHWASTIRQAFKCKLYSYYGCGESNSLGYQCDEGEAYHISEEHVVLEVDSENTNNSLPKTGRILITDLDNYAMPLLRYENGDFVTLSDQRCRCGRSLGLIGRLEGRTYEFLFNTSKELISAGICDVILGNVSAIEEFQVRQDRLDHIRVLIVSQGKLSEEDEAYIRNSFRHYLGDSMNIGIELVDHIARTKAQKLQTAINELI